MKPRTIRNGIIAAAAAFALSAARPAMALLGSFDSPDGYWFTTPGWIDVTNYNAGQFGLNAGNGPGPTAIAPSSGLWKLQSQVGDFYSNSVTRNAQIGAAPPYPVAAPGPFVSAYIVGNHSNGRTGNALAVRNATAAGTGSLLYDYTMDQYDFGGPNPSSITSGNVGLSFWFETNDPDPNVQPNGSGDKFIMSFKDSTGTIGFQWGYARNNTVQWHTGSTGAWNTTSMITDNTQYDGLQVNINLSSQTFGIDYFDTSTSNLINIAPAGTALGNPMADFTHLGWSLADSVLLGPGGYGGKNFFDDFKFSVVPEPGSTMLAISLGACFLLRRPMRGAFPKTLEEDEFFATA